jgi:hypothetical protein
MILKILVGVVAVVGAFLAYVALKPAEFRVAREMAIQAPAERIFPHLNNARLMHEWNPWTQMDAKARLSYEGPAEGVGARTVWVSDGQLGVGSATVSESLPNQRVVTRLVYEKPMTMTQDATLEIRPAASGGSVVTWSIEGKNSFIQRLMCTFMNMDRYVGDTFVKGLTTLKAKVERI